MNKILKIRFHSGSNYQIDYFLKRFDKQIYEIFSQHPKLAIQKEIVSSEVEFKIRF